MSSTNTNENKGIFSQACEYIHQTAQSDKDRETIKEGEKSSVTRALEQVNISSGENDKSEDNKKGFIGGAVESTRKSIYNATKSRNERELEEKAQMTIAEKATAEVQEMARKDYEAWKAGKSTGKDHVEATVEKAEKKVGNVQDKAQDKVEAAVNTAQENAHQVVAEAKETGSEVLRQGQETAEKVDDGLHYAVLPVEGKDYNTWKQKKIENQESCEGKPKDFIDKAKAKVGGWFSSGKKEEVSQ